jgi:hypothetical protein
METLMNEIQNISNFVLKKGKYANKKGFMDKKAKIEVS